MKSIARSNSYQLPYPGLTGERNKLSAITDNLSFNQNDTTHFSSCAIAYEHVTPVLNSPLEEQLLSRFDLPARFHFDKQTNRTAKPTHKAEISLPELLSTITTLTEERQLALMFLDVRNFTNLMETHSPQKILPIIRVLFILFNKSIKEYGGKIIESSGDSIYAVFGMESSVASAVKAAIDTSQSILADLDIFNASYATPYHGIHFEIGIGVHQGRVAVSQSDLDGFEHLTVMGLAVNIAARLQAATTVLNNNFLISEEALGFITTYQKVKKQTILLKGISSPCSVALLGRAYQY